MRLNSTRVVRGGIVPSLLALAGLAAAQGSPRLVEAVRHRDKEAVRALLKQRIDVNTPEPDGATALHWAVHWDDLETADLLIRAGARVNAATEYGVTSLSLACENGNAVMVEKLLAAGANPNAARSTGEPVLMTAARTGNVAVVNALLARGADVNAKEGWQGQTALMWAASERHLEVVRTLIEHGADIHARSTTKNGFTPLLFAAREGALEIIRLLLAKGVNVNETASDGSTALLVATVRSHVALVHFLLDHGADPNAAPAGYTPLHWAVGRWESALTGEERGINAPPSSEWSALDGLHGQAKLDAIKALLAHGTNLNARATRNPPRFGGGGGPNMVGGTPFFIAAAAGDVPVMRLLLANGADPMLASNNNTTPLMVAAGLNRIEDSRVRSRALDAVKFLVEELGADVNVANEAGDTGLHAAAADAADELVQYLVDKGANINAKNKKGWTPLTMADGIYVNATFQVRKSTADLLRKLGAPENPLDCQIPGNQQTIGCAVALIEAADPKR